MGDIMRYIVDRIENGYVVLEDDNQAFINVSIDEFNFDIEEGNVIDYIDGEYIKNFDAENKRTEIIKEKMESVWDD